MGDEVKKINIDEEMLTGKKKQIKIEKIRKDRIITKEKKWCLKDEEYEPECQLKILKEEESNDIYKLITREICKKISGYKSQDQKKKKYDTDLFIDERFIKEILIETEMNCYYCKKKTLLLYKSVREPLQWSVERIDNNFGHNKDNVTIACLSCNLRRKTMYHERFRFTKQLKIEKIG